MELRYKDILLRQATKTDAKQLAAWWNDGGVMAHAGFPNGLGITEKEVAEGLREGMMMIEVGNRVIGECCYRDKSEHVAEIGIKICDSEYQNRGIGKVVLSMLIHTLFQKGYRKIVLDTNLNNTRAQHVYESIGFKKIRVNRNSWTDQLGKLQSSVDYELTEKCFVDFAISDCCINEEIYDDI